jgi:hypothetical protein
MTGDSNTVRLEDVLRHIDQALIANDAGQVQAIAEIIKTKLEKDEADVAVLYFEKGYKTMCGKGHFKQAYEAFMMTCKGRPNFQIDIVNSE